VKIPIYAQGKPHNENLYLLEDNGKRTPLEAKENWVASNRTDGLCEIWDSNTGMVSTASVYLDESERVYIKKKARWSWNRGPSKYYLDDFAIDEEAK
jgi:hypothetical protein